VTDKRPTQLEVVNIVADKFIEVAVAFDLMRLHANTDKRSEEFVSLMYDASVRINQLLMTLGDTLQHDWNMILPPDDEKGQTDERIE